MAILKEITNPLNGVVSTYHRISRITIFPKESIYFNVSEYLNEDARKFFGSMSMEEFKLTMDEFTLINYDTKILDLFDTEQIIIKLYNYLMTLEKYKDGLKV